MEKKQKRGGWHQLKQGDRDRMEVLLDAEMFQKDIAKVLKVDPGTISRERKRQRKNGRYDAANAGIKAKMARGHSKYQGMKVNADAAMKAHIIAELGKKRSPDEIAGRMKLEEMPFYASKNAVYKWLYSVHGQRYAPLLCTKRYGRKKQKKKTARTMIPNRKSIDCRPLGAANRTRYGHYEGDTIVAPKKAGNTDAVAVAVERKTRFLLAARIPSLAPREMTAAINAFEKRTSMLSITIDNGIENKGHGDWAMPAFCADPHSPWQKPLVECTIGLLRRWHFKKGTDWSLVSEEKLQEAALMINNKYRKSLGYRSAMEVELAHGMMKKSNDNNVRTEIAIQ
jgi:IS30 family transposase